MAVSKQTSSSGYTLRLSLFTAINPWHRAITVQLPSPLVRQFIMQSCSSRWNGLFNFVHDLIRNMEQPSIYVWTINEPHLPKNKDVMPSSTAQDTFQPRSGLISCTNLSCAPPPPPGRNGLANKVNFFGLIPKSGKDQWDCSTVLKTVKFVQSPFEYPYLFWVGWPQNVLMVARLHCRKSVH